MSSTDVDPEPAQQHSKAPMLIVGLGLVALLAVGVGIWVFFSGDEPEEVDLSTAVEQVEDSVAEQGSPDTTPPADVVIEGTWTVGESSGEVGFGDDASGSFVGFRVEEELASIGSTTAVGRTPEVSGTLEIVGTELTMTEIEADMTAITSDRSQRDSRVQSALETDDFATATFVLTSPVDLGTEATDGEPVAVTAIGDLTIHGVTESIEFPLEAQVVDESIVVVGATDITFSDFDVEAPSSSKVLSVSDDAVIELQLIFDMTE